MPEGQPTEEELQNMSQEEIAELQKKNCVFCKIIKGEVPSHKVYEDDKMIALLDIYPAAKGHVLVLPKEHVPIMPLIPPEVFKHLFKNSKYLAKAVKKGIPAIKSTVFIANGASAGQQSPHFLFHVIPRDKGDGLEMLDVKGKGVSQDDILTPLKSNLTMMMQNHLKREGKTVVKGPSKEELAKMIEDNPQLRELIKTNPEELKKQIEKNEQLKAMFHGIDIDKLSERMRKLDEDDEESSNEQEESKPDSEQEPEKQEESTEETDEPKQEESKEPVNEPELFRHPKGVPQEEKQEEPEEPEQPKKENKGTDLDDISNMFT